MGLGVVVVLGATEVEVGRTRRCALADLGDAAAVEEQPTVLTREQILSEVASGALSPAAAQELLDGINEDAGTLQVDDGPDPQEDE